MKMRNPAGTDGVDFLEFTAPDPDKLSAQFESMGFQRVMTHHTCPITLYQQNDIRFIINSTKDSQAGEYARFHGVSISAMGMKVRDADSVLQYVRLKGATPYQPLDEKTVYDMPAIYGVGNMLIYLVDYKKGTANYAHQFSGAAQASSASSEKFTHLDHVTFNLYRGHLIKWADFYTRLFNFQEVRPVSAENKIPGFKSKTITSPCGKIRIELNESSHEKSPVEAFLNHFNGEGIQRIALGTGKQDARLTFLDTLDQLQHGSMKSDSVSA